MKAIDGNGIHILNKQVNRAKQTKNAHQKRNK